MKWLLTFGALAGLVLTVPLGAQTVPSWRVVKEATFGSSGNPAAEFVDVRGIEVSKNGNLLILDYKSQNIKVFSPNGAYLKALSRNGQGPGEFLEPNGFARAPDGNIWVNDPTNVRFTVLRDDGGYIRDIPSGALSSTYLWTGTFDAAGRLLRDVYAHNPRSTVARSRERMLERRQMNINRADTLPWPQCVPAGERMKPHSWSARSATGGMSMQIPYVGSMFVAVSPHDFAWCTMGSEYTVYRLGLVHGDTQVVIHGKAPRLAVSATERDSVVAMAKREFEKAHVDASAIAWGDVPRVKPIVIGLSLDDQGSVWVRLTSIVAGQSRFDVYDTRGVAIGTVDLPEVLIPAPLLLIRGDKLYGVVRDADDVASVVRYRFQVVK